MLLRQVEAGLLNDLTLKGIPAITKYTQYKNRSAKEAIYDPETGAQKDRVGDFIIETDGVALKKVLAVEKVDHTRTTSNAVREIVTVLGVEAARRSLIHELRFVLDSYDIYVNYRHLSTLCDIMTNRGALTAITRHGINRGDSGALRKCSFEETVEILLEAAFHAEVDPLSGITENIIMGQLAPYGTGSFDLMVDTEMLKEANENIAEVLEGDLGRPDLLDEIEGRTPVWMTPTGPPGGGASSYYGPGATPYGAFTPLPGSTSPLPTSPLPAGPYNVYAAPSSPIYISGATPGPTPGGQTGLVGHSGYSPTSPAYQRGPGTTPAYNVSSSPGYYGVSRAGSSSPGYQGITGGGSVG
jgi:DNA-directed RNA polymerase II subunit RPB1